MKLDHIPTYTKDHCNVIIETPRENRNKFDYDPEFGVFKLSKVLPQGHVFPYDFGFLPGTLGEDGDPLDVLVLSDTAVGFPGCLVPTRLIGVIEAEQTERDGKTTRNDRLVGVATVARTYEKVKNLEDLTGDVVEELRNFFISYNEQAGKKFVPQGDHGAERAEKLVKEGMKRHRKG